MPRNLRKRDKKPVGSVDAGLIQKCLANWLRIIWKCLGAISGFCAASAKSRSLSSVRRASHLRRLMSVIERPMKIQRPSFRAQDMTRLAKVRAEAEVDQY